MERLNKTQQNSTKMTNINPNTGLTPKQEKAAYLLVSGKSITDTAKEIGIDRTTLYNWMEGYNYKAFYNKVCQEIQKNIVNGLWGLYDKAMQAISAGLESENESLRIKSAFWLIERLSDKKTGESDPKKMIEGICRQDKLNMDFGISFDKDMFEKLCKTNNLSD